MKKVLFIFAIAIFFTVPAKSQLIGSPIVHDPINYGQLGAIFQQGAQQVQQVTKQLGFLQDAKKAVTVVSSALKTLRTVEKVIDLSKSTVNQIDNVQRRLGRLNSLDPGYISVSASYCMRCTNQATDNVTMLTSILSNGALRLNDSERLREIQQSISEMEMLTVQVNRLLRTAERINSKSQALICF